MDTMIESSTKHVYSLSKDEIEKIYNFMRAHPKEELFELICVQTGIGVAYSIRPRSLKNHAIEDVTNYDNW